MSDKPVIFISHIHEEKDLAEILKDAISNAFLGLFDVFVSSDGTSIKVGNKWLEDVDNALKSAKAMLMICSNESVGRPWVNFEAGAGWVRGIPVVPICHTGMRRVDLPIPLNMLQAIEASNTEHLKQLMQLLASQLSSANPAVDYQRLATVVEEFEREYGVVRIVKDNILTLIQLLADLKRVFDPQPEARVISGDLGELLIDKMKPSLNELQEMGMITYSLGRNKMTFSAGGGGGNMIEIRMEVQDTYYAIADKVMRP